MSGIAFALEYHRNHDNEPLENGLILGLHISQAKDVVEYRENERTNERATDGADAAHEVGATNDDCSDCVEFITLPIDVRTLAHKCSMQAGSERYQNASDDVHGDFDAVCIDT